MIPVFFHTGYRYKNFDTEQAYRAAKAETVSASVARIVQFRTQMLILSQRLG